jgi:hypothetical protein
MVALLLRVTLVRRMTLAGVLSVARFAAADDQAPRPSSLSWVRAEGAESCPPPSAIAKLVEERLGRSVFVSPARAELAVEAYAERAADSKWHIAISVSKKDGEVAGRRVFWSDESSCTPVAENAALAIALMIDPDAMLRPEQPKGPKIAEPVPVVIEPAPAPVAAVPPVPIAPPPWRGALEASTGITTGLLPGIAPSVSLRARAIEPSRTWALELEGAYFFAQEAELRPNSGAALALFYTGLSACASPGAANRVSALLCVGAHAGSMTAQGYGFVVDAPKDQNLVVGVVGRGRMAIRLHEQWTVLIGAHGIVPLKRDYFEARLGAVTQAVFRSSVVAGGVDLGVAYEF